MAGEGAPVIKLSGKALNDRDNLKRLFELLRGRKAVIVHGGGVEVDDILSKMGFKSEKIEGLRVSPKEQMPYITAALSGICNKKLQALALSCGSNALGLLATDGGSVGLDKLGKRFGQVASATPGDGSFLQGLMDNGILPVVCSIGIDGQGELYNINADDLAAALARLFHSRLYFISDVRGVFDEKREIIDELNENKVNELIAKKVIIDGMLVKVRMALEVARKTGTDVTIASLEDPRLYESLFGPGRFGTTFVAGG